MSETSELISLQSSCSASLALVCIKQKPPRVLQLTFITEGQTHLSGLISVCSEIIYSLLLLPNICWKCNGTNHSLLQPKPSRGADVPSPVSLHCNTCRPLLSSPTFFPLCRLSITPVYGRIGNHLPRNGAQSHLIPHASTHPNLLSPTQTLFSPLPGLRHLRRRDVKGVKTGRCEASVWGLSDSLLWPLGGSAGGPAFINTPQLSLAWIKQNVFHAVEFYYIQSLSTLFSALFSWSAI